MSVELLFMFFLKITFCQTDFYQFFVSLSFIQNHNFLERNEEYRRALKRIEKRKKRSPIPDNRKESSTLPTIKDSNPKNDPKRSRQHINTIWFYDLVWKQNKKMGLQCLVMWTIIGSLSHSFIYSWDNLVGHSYYF